MLVRYVKQTSSLKQANSKFAQCCTYPNNETFSYIIIPRYERDSDVREIYPSFVSRSLLSSLELGSVVREAEPVKTEREHDNQKTGKGLCRILKHVRV